MGVGVATASTTQLLDQYVHAITMSSLFILLFIITKLGVSTCCHTFNNTKMTVVSKLGERYQTSVTGCIERGAFENRITEIYIKNQPLPFLERDAVRHMVQLKKLSFDSCQMKTIQRSVFRNVPRLKFIQFVYNDLGEIRNGIFSQLLQLEILKLTNNNIKIIENDAFSNLTTLKVVDCSNNLLQNWTKEWFGNSTNLVVINFQYNQIRNLPRRAFSNFQKLKEVLFDYNNLEIIYPEAFDEITNLDYLGLKYNKLTNLDYKIFPNEIAIKTFSIGANYLNYLPMRLMAKLSVNVIEVGGNPWKCPCMEQVYQWLFEINATVRCSEYCKGSDLPVCVYPSSYSYTCVEKVDEEATTIFLGKLKELEPPLDGSCARMDELIDNRKK